MSRGKKKIMQKHIKLGLYVVCFFAAGLLNACQDAPSTPESQKELLIYCGITMAQPIREIADIFEEQENVAIRISSNGSGELYRSLKFNRKGDLYLPGSESYIQTCAEERLISQQVPVGFNQAAFVTQKGNRLRISAEVTNMIDPALRTAMGSPETGSIGRETRRILEQAGIYQEALAHCQYMTSDSKGLKNVILDNQADLALNWRATAVWPENNEHMEIIPLDEKVAPPQRLILGLLTFSRHPEWALRFMSLAASPQGQAIFARYGFGKIAP